MHAAHSNRSGIPGGSLDVWVRKSWSKWSFCLGSTNDSSVRPRRHLQGKSCREMMRARARPSARAVAWHRGGEEGGGGSEIIHFTRVRARACLTPHLQQTQTEAAPPSQSQYWIKRDRCPRAHPGATSGGRREDWECARGTGIKSAHLSQQRDSARGVRLFSHR